jgi:hypothetical protein
LVCANSALDNGAKVVLIAASKGNVSRGGSNHAMNSKLMQANADKFPIPEIGEHFRKELVNNGYNVDEDKWWLYGKYSEEAMNWMIDKMAPSGYQCVLEATTSDPTGIMDIPVGSHAWINDKNKTAGMAQQIVVDYLAKTAKAAGATLVYETVAEQLVREDNNTGRVTAVIAKGPDGTYTKYVGTKAIVLATGDFSADSEMMAKYAPAGLPMMNTAGDRGYDNGWKIGGLFKGDGQKMGLWVGAAWQRTFPNCIMAGTQIGPGHAALLVNKNGYRYSNEDSQFQFMAWSHLHQPGGKVFCIWGTNHAADTAPWLSGTIRGEETEVPPADVVAGWESSVKNGSMVKADTIEELIKKLGLPADETKATIDRYNELCAKGVDEDRFKRAKLMVPVKTGPFYGQVAAVPGMLTVMGGLRTNNDMQVCDANDQPIPGLYNIGTMVGDFYANIYNFLTYGLNLGACCVTFGYLTGRKIAKSA